MPVKYSVLLTVLTTLLLAARNLAAEIEIGAAGPDFSAVGVDDQPFQLANVKDAKLVVLCFTCNDCPVARAYEERLIEFVNQFESKGVKLIAVNCNNRTENLQVMKKHAAEAGFNFPYVFDQTGQAARAYGAQVTPHLFVLDSDRKVAYRGAFDDSQQDPRTAYVVDAVTALLEGKTPTTSSTKAFGCGIKLKEPATN